MSSDNITITLKEYENLKEQAFMLACLERGGVDNWDWYSESLQPYFKKYYPDEYEEDEDEE